MNLLQTRPILVIESNQIDLIDRTFLKAARVSTTDYKKELPNRVRQEFRSRTFALRLDKLITELILQSFSYADKQAKQLTAAAPELNPSYVLTEEAVRLSGELSKECAESVVRMLVEDAIYYESPRALATRITDLWGNEKYRAERFARTFTADVATASTVSRYRQLGIRYMEFNAEVDDKTTNQCRCLDGTIFDLEKGSVDAYRPPLHMHCRSGLIPITEDEYDKSREFENRDFSTTLDDPKEVDRAFKQIDSFNDKYRVSKLIIDKDLAARYMFEKGFSVGIDGLDLSGILTTINDAAKPAMYTESKTIKEAEQWVRDNSKVKYVDFKGIDVRTANAMNESFARHMELHPELADKIKYFGTTQGQTNLAYKLDFENSVNRFMSVGYDRAQAEQFAKAVVSKSRVPSNEIAGYWARADDACGIGINKNVGKSFDAVQKQLEREVADGFKPVGCDSLKATFDHEFGHALDDLYNIKSNPKFTQYISGLSGDEQAAALSQYGATKADEFIAEAWSEYLNNPTPRPAAKFIGELIEENIKGV